MGIIVQEKSPFDVTQDDFDLVGHYNTWQWRWAPTQSDWHNQNVCTWFTINQLCHNNIDLKSKIQVRAVEYYREGDIFVQIDNKSHRACDCPSHHRDTPPHAFLSRNKWIAETGIVNLKPDCFRLEIEEFLGSLCMKMRSVSTYPRKEVPCFRDKDHSGACELL